MNDFCPKDYNNEYAAVAAMESAQDEGYDEMWVGYVECLGDGKTAIQFCCGDAEHTIVMVA